MNQAVQALTCDGCGDCIRADASVWQVLVGACCRLRATTQALFGSGLGRADIACILREAQVPVTSPTESARKAVETDRQLGGQFGVQGTPTFVLLHLGMRGRVVSLENFELVLSGE